MILLLFSLNLDRFLHEGKGFETYFFFSGNRLVKSSVQIITKNCQNSLKLIHCLSFGVAYFMYLGYKREETFNIVDDESKHNLQCPSTQLDNARCLPLGYIIHCMLYDLTKLLPFIFLY